MQEEYREEREPRSWSTREAYLLAMVCLFAGILVGYFLRGSSGGSPLPSAPAQQAAAPAAPPQQTPPSPAALQVAVQPMLDALRLDPRNADTLIQLGNTYFDHQAYNEAIQYYSRALQIRPNDVNVRTDLGTSYFYAGKPEKAIEEFNKSLALNPTHPNTLFNMGIVKKDGLHDNAGAIAAWEKLLQTNPDYPQKQKVLDLIAQAKGSGNR